VASLQEIGNVEQEIFEKPSGIVFIEGKFRLPKTFISNPNKKS